MTFPVIQCGAGGGGTQRGEELITGLCDILRKALPGILIERLTDSDREKRKTRIPFVMDTFL